jgi:hypothetical protein
MDPNFTLLIVPDKGTGVFANKEYTEGELLGGFLQNTPPKVGRQITATLWESDTLGRFCNHSEKANTSLVKTESGYVLYANKDIEKGDEITVNYYAVEFKLNIPRGTHVNNTFVRKDYKNYGKTICEY